MGSGSDAHAATTRARSGSLHPALHPNGSLDVSSLLVLSLPLVVWSLLKRRGGKTPPRVRIPPSPLQESSAVLDCPQTPGSPGVFALEVHQHLCCSLPQQSSNALHCYRFLLLPNRRV